MGKKDELQSQLFGLKRLKQVAKIDEDLVKKIADYLRYSFQIQYLFRQQELKVLLSKLPQNIKEQFMYQSSTAFFSKMPFFYLLKSETKKLLNEKINMSILPPTYQLTHNTRNRHGFSKIYALRYGKLGLGYKKRNSTMNGFIVDSISVDIGDYPILLNSFLMNRKYKLNYSIICQKFCNIVSIEYDQFRECLTCVSLDFQLWRQVYDSDTSLSQEWFCRECGQCKQQYHSRFNCPKFVYMPLRSIIYLRKVLQKEDHQIQLLKKSHRSYFQQMSNYGLQIRQKKKYSKKSPLKYWKRLFVPLERNKFLSIHKQFNLLKFQAEKDSRLSLRDSSPTTDRRIKKHKRIMRQLNKFKMGQSSLEEKYFQVDVPYDFQNYFQKHNPKQLVKFDLNQYEIPISMFRMSSA